MSLFPHRLLVQAQELLYICRFSNLRLTVAESCTGGLICAVLTEIPGASSVLCDGFITYSNTSKVKTLSISTKLLQVYSPVSEFVAKSMLEGAFSRCSDAHLAVAVTGIAGQDNSLPNCFNGLVYLAAAHRGFSLLQQRTIFLGSRANIRFAVTSSALHMLTTLATCHTSKQRHTNKEDFA